MAESPFHLARSTAAPLEYLLILAADSADMSLGEIRAAIFAVETTANDWLKIAMRKFKLASKPQIEIARATPAASSEQALRAQSFSVYRRSARPSV